MQKSAIVTGANSFIGKAVVKELLRAGYYVCALSHTGKIPGISREDRLEIRSFELDNAGVYDPIFLPDGTSYEHFFHFAWEGAVGPARLDGDLQLNNAKGAVECLRYAARCGCESFIGAGTIVELEILELLNRRQSFKSNYNYGYGKLTAHGFCQMEAEKLDIRFIWPIITNIYGPGEKNERFITWAVKNLLKNQPLHVTECKQNYDFVYIDDAARAFRLLAEKGKESRHYVVGSGNAQPLKNFLMKLPECVNENGVIHFGKAPFQGVFLPIEAFDSESLREDTGFCCETEFSKGCRELAGWLLKKGEL